MPRSRDMNLKRLSCVLVSALAVGDVCVVVRAGAEEAQRRHPDERRHRLDRLRCLPRRRGPRPPDAEPRSPGQGRRDVHELVRPGKLHRGPRLVHDRAHPDPLGAVGRRRSRRPERPQEGDADHRRVLPEERLLHLLLRQVASRRRGEVLPDRARLRRDEGVRRLLSGRLRLQRHGAQCAPVVPERQRRILEDVSGAS